MYKQIIIVRKDLGMSHGKLAAQVSHGSMAFLTDMIRKNSHYVSRESEEESCFCANLEFDSGLYNEWINDAFTKTVLKARNKNHLLKAKKNGRRDGNGRGGRFFLHL